MGNCLLLRGIKSSTSEGIHTIPPYYLHVLLPLVTHISIFKQKHSLFLLQKLEIGQAIKPKCKYKASCPISPPLRPALEKYGLSSSSGLAYGVWSARRGAPRAQRCVRKPFTVTQRQKCPLSCYWDSLCPNVKSSLHPHLSLAHLVSCMPNSEGRLLADCCCTTVLQELVKQWSLRGRVALSWFCWPDWWEGFRKLKVCFVSFCFI